MKKSKVVHISYIVGLLLMFLLFKSYHNRTVKKHENSIDKLKQFQERFSEVHTYTSSLIKTSMQDEGKYFTIKDLESSGFDNLEKYKEPVGSLPVLVVRFSQRHCSSCIEDLISLLNKNISQKISVKVVFLTDFLKSIYAKSFIKQNDNFLFPMRNIGVSGTGLKSESVNLPFMFIVDKENKIRQVFTHVKEDKTRTIHYLKAIVDNYLN